VAFLVQHISHPTLLVFGNEIEFAVFLNIDY